MSTQVFWTNSAQYDLKDIIEYISKDGASQASKIYFGIKNACLKLEEFPLSGRIIPELKIQNVTIYREVIYKIWRVLYKVDHEKIYIMAVIDSRRNLDDLLIARALRSI